MLPRGFLTIPIVSSLGYFRQCQRILAQLKGKYNEELYFQFLSKHAKLGNALLDIDRRLDFLKSYNEETHKEFFTRYLIYEFLLRDNQLDLAKKLSSTFEIDLSGDIELYYDIFESISALERGDIKKAAIFLRDHASGEISDNMCRLKIHELFQNKEEHNVLNNIAAISQKSSNWNENTCELFKELLISLVTLSDDPINLDERVMDLKNELQSLLGLNCVPYIHTLLVSALISFKTPDCGLCPLNTCLACDPLFKEIMEKLPTNPREYSHIVCSVTGKVCSPDTVLFCAKDGVLVSEEGLSICKGDGDEFVVNGEKYIASDFMRLFISA